MKSGYRTGVRTFGSAVLLAALACVGARARAQEFRTFATPQDLMRAMIEQERQSAAKHERYEYLSEEKSDRTGFHLWKERVVETSVGKVRMLLAEDGVPLNAERQAQERARLAAIVADPSDFEAKEASRMNDEAHMRSMLDDIPRGFLLNGVELQGGVWHLNFQPNMAYSPSGIEERVLHGMSGWLTIDAASLRLMHIEARLPTDVSIGFGLLATIKTGSHFSSDRQFLEGHWRTVKVITDIRGRAALFKSVSRSSDLTRGDFHYLDPNITVAQAVALVEKE